MIIIYLNRLNDFAKKHADSRKSLNVWKLVVENVIWLVARRQSADSCVLSFLNDVGSCHSMTSSATNPAGKNFTSIPAWPFWFYTKHNYKFHGQLLPR